MRPRRVVAAGSAVLAGPVVAAAAWVGGWLVEAGVDEGVENSYKKWAAWINLPAILAEIGRKGVS